MLEPKHSKFYGTFVFSKIQKSFNLYKSFYMEHAIMLANPETKRLLFRVNRFTFNSGIE